MVSTNATRASLLGRAIDRDETAWRQIVELYGPLVAFWCHSFGCESNTTADVIQEVFLTVSKSLHRFQSVPGCGAFRGWLWKVTRNKLLDLRRESQNRFPAEGGSDALHRLHQQPDLHALTDSEPSSIESMSLLMERAMTIIRNDFRVETWAAFCRTVIDGQSTEVVANELGISSAGVRQVRSRVLRRLRELCDLPD